MTDNTEYSTYYEILSVSTRASHDEIEDAYHDLARKLHPDVTGNDPAMTETYMTVNEAYHVLSNQDEREKYDELIGVDKNSGKSPDPKPKIIHDKTEAADMKLLDAKLMRSTRQAEKLCGKGNYWEATRLLEKYLNTHPDSPHLRKVLATAAAGMNRFHDAVNHMKIVCKIEYHDPENYVMLGKIYIQADQLLLAERSMNEALAWNSEHEEAKRMIREIRELKDAKGSVFTRVLRKMSHIIRHEEE
ncbi:MAG: DnaJ domain-containing protein [Candidatus Aegiribacteria sp.]|nr:DnaJ domain-containing protein [Candidatus Aegiribacteria sp.]